MGSYEQILRTLLLAGVIVIASVSGQGFGSGAARPGGDTAWRGPAGAGSPACAADLNGDTTVDAGDLAILLGAWGPCQLTCLDPTVDPVDLNCSGTISCEDADGGVFIVDIFECFCLEGASEAQCCDEISQDLEAACDFPGGSIVPGSLFCGCF
jgi:hypothetical protein